MDGRRALGSAATAVVLAVGVAAVGLRLNNGRDDSLIDLTAGHGPTVRPVDPNSVYSPVAAGESMPSGFYQVVPRDLIPPLYDPTFVAADDAGWAGDVDVVGVEIDGKAKAYPVSVLNGHEMVVDRLAGVPILVTWCPVCSTAVVHRRVLEGDEVVFGVQGALYLNAQTWWDHGTGSIWSQPLGEAIAGPLAGATVEMLASSFTTWRAWRSAHPDTLALDVAAAPTDFDLSDLLVVVDFATDVRAYRVRDIRREGVINDVVADVEIAVTIDPDEPDRWAVYSRRVDGQLITLDVADGVLHDRASGSTFGFERGLGIDGPLGDRQLAQLPALVAKPGGGPMRFPVFGAFWPDGTTWRADPDT